MDNGFTITEGQNALLKEMMRLSKEGLAPIETVATFYNNFQNGLYDSDIIDAYSYMSILEEKQVIELFIDMAINVEYDVLRLEWYRKKI